MSRIKWRCRRAVFFARLIARKHKNTARSRLIFSVHGLLIPMVCKATGLIQTVIVILHETGVTKTYLLATNADDVLCNYTYTSCRLCNEIKTFVPVFEQGLVGFTKCAAASERNSGSRKECRRF